jgi:hypothetical protein
LSILLANFFASFVNTLVVIKTPFSERWFTNAPTKPVIIKAAEVAISKIRNFNKK